MYKATCPLQKSNTQKRCNILYLEVAAKGGGCQ